MSAFARENVFSSCRSRLIARVTLKAGLNKFGIYPLTWAVNYSLEKTAKPTLSARFRSGLRKDCRSDIVLLESVLGRDFSEWGDGAVERSRSRVPERAPTRTEQSTRIIYVLDAATTI